MSLIFKTPLNAKNTTTKGSQNIYGYPGCDLVEGSAEYTENGEYTLEPEEADGFSSVEIKVAVPSDVHNQEKEATPTTSSQEITPDENYTGLSKVTIAGVTASIDANITAGNIKKDVEILGVTGSYDPQPNLDTLNVTPSTSAQTLTPTSPVDGFDEVVVSAVTSSIDANISAGNIKKDVTILGVTGNYDPQPDLEAKTVNSSTVQQIVTPTAGKDGLSSVTVEPYVLQAKTATPTTSQQVIEPDNDKDGLSSVTVSAVTSAIDANIAAGNIKDGVTILGVTGDYTGGGGCIDWASIGWTCNDVNNYTYIPAQVAYTESVKDQTTWANDTQLVFAPKTTTGNSNGQLFSGCTNLQYVPDFTITGNNIPYSGMFNGCTNLKKVGSISCPNKDSTSSADNMFQNCRELESVGTIDMKYSTQAINMFSASIYYSSTVRFTAPVLINTSAIESTVNMFSGRGNMTNESISIISNYDLSAVYIANNMFYSCYFNGGSFPTCTLTTAPSFDTSNFLYVENMFGTNYGGVTGTLTTVPKWNLSKVSNVHNMFGSQNNLTDLGGFTGLGLGFNTNNASYNTLDLSASSVLTKASIMNVINEFGTVQSAVTTATLKLSATSYALLDASDIAIATAKNWSVVSA